MRRFFFDTEFVEDGETIMPISLGMVSEDGRSLYIEYDFDEEKARAHDFVRENVLPHLAGQERYTREQAAERIAHFMGLGPKHPAESRAEAIEIWAYFADYDWIVFCQTFGTMMDLPDGCPMFCMDLMQWWTQLGRPRGAKPPKPVKAHHALADADWNLEFYRRLSAFSGDATRSALKRARHAVRYCGGAIDGDGERRSGPEAIRMALVALDDLMEETE